MISHYMIFLFSNSVFGSSPENWSMLVSSNIPACQDSLVLNILEMIFEGSVLYNFMRVRQLKS